jgi:hypothetical protein
MTRGALQTRDRHELHFPEGPGSAVHRFAQFALRIVAGIPQPLRAAPHPGHADYVDDANIRDGRRAARQISHCRRHGAISTGTNGS